VGLPGRAFHFDQDYFDVKLLIASDKGKQERCQRNTNNYWRRKMHKEYKVSF
jgi:hypothetical protein